MQYYRKSRLRPTKYLKFRYTETLHYTYNYIFTYKQSIYFLQNKYEYISIIYTNNKYNY